jgi:hypothetical protein
LEPLEKAKTYILQCKMYVFPEMAKNIQNLYQNLLFRQLTFQKTHILQCKMYVFDSGAPNLKFQPKIGKTYI